MSISFKFAAAALTGTIALSACTDPRLLNDGSDPNRTRDGAIVGGLVGAATGALTGEDAEDRRRRAVGGAVIGAAAGGVIGNQLDKQEAELRQQMGNNVGIQNTGNELILTLPQDILFATDSASLRPDLQSDLRSLAANLQRYPNTTVDVIGHTDNTGAASYNQQLSQRRAQSVAGVLINSGVNPARVRSIGRGEDQPIASNLDAAGRQQNRRVEVIIRPN
ncbi:OmpA family protein [Tropicimonas sp. IMCC34011]|uniref:OmpA family protein n=1 Tax=Tropicimonas sp. IMCC34011 TaxID=2248759 RepID=UPI000E26ADE3|nr:OmpA family protein [Tropicimonas sp. IMCC34011]